APPPVESEAQVGAEDRARGEQNLLPEREGPEERHAVEEAQEERRIAEGGERAADVGDEKDEEHQRVSPVPARAVGAQERADEEHGGAGRSHRRGALRSAETERAVLPGGAERPASQV